MKFNIETPLGFSVHCTEASWEKITTQKHTDLADKMEQVKDALGDPDEVRQSKSDAAVLLFYRGQKPRFICAVVKTGDSAFLITAYQTNTMKTGDLVWQKSK